MAERITLKQHREKLELAEQVISDATDYTDEYLKYGSSCDSSKDAALRMEYVKMAEKQFIQNNKWQILKIAAQLIRDEINDACTVSNLH